MLDSLIAQNNVVKVSDTEYKTNSDKFRDLLKALIGNGTNFKLTVTDKTLPENFFQSICWDDLDNIDYTYTLDLSETEIEVIPGWNTLNQFYNGGNCIKITGVILPDTIKKIDDGTFQETSIESIIIPDSCEWIGAAILPESSYTNYRTKNIIISDDNYSNWKALDYEDDLIDKWNNKETDGSYDLGTEGFYEWHRHFKVN